MAKSKIIQPVKGTRDYYPELMAVRKWLYEVAALVSSAFGYQEYEGPLIESLELYAAKSGDELVKEQSFVFEDRGGNLITLRPELTPTLARMVAQQQNQLTFPLRWWSFGPFWRYERPQKGRTREFFQWNIDLIGSDSPTADAELVAIVASFFQAVGLSPDEAQILVNNRYLMEGELAEIGIQDESFKDIFRLIDRRDKLAPLKWRDYAKDLGLTLQQIDQLEELLRNDDLWQKSPALQGLFPAVESLGVGGYVRFAPYIIRGLDYYTGTVFEAQAIKGDVRRAILGGGRYDNLLSDVGGNQIPAVGFAMGDLVITLVLEELDLIPTDIKTPAASILVTVFNEDSLQESLTLSKELREAGLKVACYPQADKLGKQLKYADKTGVKIALLLGPDEIAAQKVTLKELSSGNQETIPRAESANKLKRMLDLD
ncbi:MAG: histidine--tRNA ligase [Chloroflexota bacterium]|nr:MAG: histidine--tRNA ligase [Chloroflexota bacterium]